MAARILGVFMVFAVCGFAPGWMLVRRRSWSVPEKLVAATAISIILLYGVSFAVFLLELPGWTHFVITAACCIPFVLSLRDLRSLISDRDARDHLVWFGFALLWTFLALCLIRNVSAGRWSGDWLEHYQRARFFLEQKPSSEGVVLGGHLAARPPLENLVAAHFLALFGDEFAVHQVAVLVLNTSAFLALCLFVGRATSEGRPPIGLLGMVVLLNPMFLQNSTYGWTRGLTSFFLLSAIHFFASAVEKRREPERWIVAAMAAAGALLTHYSAGPYLVALGGWFLWRVARRSQIGVRSAAVAASMFVALFGSWVAWSTHAYGLGTTFGANSTILQSAHLSFVEHAHRFAANLGSTIIPHTLRTLDAPWLRETYGLGWLKDSLFHLYQTNLILAFGSTGFALLAYVVVRAGWLQWGFWSWLVGASLLLGIAVNERSDDLGIAHMCLQPLVLMGLAVLAGKLGELPRSLRTVFVTGLAIDAVAGIGLLFWFQSGVPPSTLESATLAGFSPITLVNARVKRWAVGSFLGDAAAGYQALIWVALLALLCLLLRECRRQIPDRPRYQRISSEPQNT